MKDLSRRGFLAGGAGLASAGLVAPSAGVTPAAAASAAVDKQQPGGLFPPDRIGLQLYSVADQIESLGFAKTLSALAEMGYKCVEFAGYTDSTGVTPKDIRGLLEANGLRAIGAHVSPSDDESLKQILADSAAIGVPNVGISLPLPQSGPTAAGWTELSQTYNRWGEIAAGEGIGFYLHNHFHEWFPCPDDPSRRGEDVLLAETDSRFVFFEMDVYWSYVGQWQSGQLLPFDPLTDYAIKFKDRYKLFHVKDGREDPLGGFTDALVGIVDAGQGSIDFQSFFSRLFAERPDEVDRHHYLWERDTASQHPRGSMASARASYTYIRYGLTGPNAPRAENTLAAAVVNVSAKRTAAGRRLVRVVLEAEEPVGVATKVLRGKRTLTRKAHGELAAGRHTFDLALPSSAPAGRVRLDVRFTTAAGEQVVRVPAVVPARR